MAKFIEEEKEVRKHIAQSRFLHNGIGGDFLTDTKTVSDEFIPVYGDEVVSAPRAPSTTEDTPLDTGALYGKCRACATRAIGLRARGMRPQEVDIEDTASAIFSALYEQNAEGEVVNLRNAWRKAIREGAKEFERGRRLLSRSSDIDLCADGGLTALSPRAVMVSDKASALWAECQRVNALGIEGGHKIARVLGFHSAVELREALDIVAIGRKRMTAPKVAHWSFDEANWREAVAYHLTEETSTEDGDED